MEPLIAERTRAGLRVLLLAAISSRARSTAPDDDATLAAGYRPLGLVVLEDELRADVGAMLSGSSAGVR